MASTTPAALSPGKAELPGDDEEAEGEKVYREDEGSEKATDDTRALTQDRIHIAEDALKSPSSTNDNDTKDSSPRGQDFLDEDYDELPQLTEITLEESITIAMDCSQSERSVTLDDLETSRLKMSEKSAAPAEKVMAATSQKSREKIKARPHRRKHSKTRQDSAPHPTAGDEKEIVQQHAAETNDKLYNGAMNSLVEQMHGSGNSLNYDDCLKITRHSQRRFNKALRTSLTKHKQDLDDSSVSSNSSFAQESFHRDWTGWSSSESGHGSSEVFIFSPKDRGDAHKKDFTTKYTVKATPPKQSLSPSLRSGRKQPKAKTNAKPRRSRDSLFDSTHSAPTRGSPKLYPTTEEMEKMQSSDPGRIANRTTRVRTRKRFQSLIANYEVPTGPIEKVMEKNDGSRSQRKGSKLSIARASLPFPKKEPMHGVTSQDSTVKHTNGPQEVDADVTSHDRTEVRSNRTVDRFPSTPPAKARRASTSSYGYYSPWRDMHSRKLSASIAAIKGSTPATQPLTTGSPVAKPKVQGPVLSQVAPPPLSSPPFPSDSKTMKDSTME